MTVTKQIETITYLSDTGDWALRISNNDYEILPQVGELIYQSGVNLDNLAKLIIEAKTHAIENGIIWQQ